MASESPGSTASRRLTARGAATRQRILETASDLIRAQGVGATQMEQVAAATGTGKSQLYRHFPDKRALVQAVIELRGQNVLQLHGEILANVRSIRGLERWRDVVVGRLAAVHGAFGCPLGSVAAEVAEDDEQARASLDQYFRDWESLIAAALDRMRDSGELTRSADCAALAQQIMVALQGGYLLSQVERSEEPMRRGLDMAIEHVRGFASGVQSRPEASG